MPTVPRLQRQATLDALPGVRLTAAETPESLGAGIAEAKGAEASAIAGIGAKTAAIGEEGFAKIEEEGRQQGDQIAVLNAANQLGSWKNKALYDPTTGALATRGQAALGLPEKVADDFQTTADQIESGLRNPQQKIAFAKIRNTTGLEVNEVIAKHTSSQIQQYQAQELESFLGNSRNAAISNATNPVLIGNELAAQVDAIRVHAPMLGMGPEEVQKQIDATISATHVGVIENLLAQNQTRSAKTYFEEAKDQIAGVAQPRLEKALQESGNRGEAQKQSDAIIAAGGSLTDQLAKARAIDDPEVRDRAVEYIEHNNAIGEKVKRENDEAASTAAFNILDQQNGDLRKIPPTAWVSFSGSTKSALRSYSDRLQSGESIETDWKTFYGLVDQAGRQPNDFANANLLNYRGKLSNGDFKQLADLQLSLRNKEAKPPPALERFSTSNEIVEGSIEQWNPNFPAPEKRTPEQKAAVANLRNLLDDYVEKNTKPGAKMPNSDIQAEADRILSTRATVPPSSLRTILSSIMPALVSPIPTQGKTVNELPVEQMRKYESERSKILAIQRSKGRPTDEASLLAIFMDAQGK